MLYDIAFLLFSIVYLPTLLFKGKLHRDFLERFGVYSAEKTKELASVKDTIWIQAVSVGEVAICKSLIPLLRQRFPATKIILSTITKTGNDLAKRLFAGSAIIIYFPLDLGFIVKKIVDKIRPRIYIMVETEIWPNVIRELSSRSIPSILINGRLSDRSFGKYKLVRRFLKATLERINIFCMQSPLDEERVIYLGAPKIKVRITGNMKFDADVISDTKASEEMKYRLGLKENEMLFVAGSTHRGEENIILSAFKELLKQFQYLKLLIAPRHIERTHELEGLVRQSGFEPVRISKISSLGAGSGVKVFILDTIGQLKDVYAVATVVFVGGSLVKHGGQNPVEPAFFGKPVIFGPYMFNFKNIAGAFLETRAAIEVQNEKELLDASSLLFEDGHARSVYGGNAKKVVVDNKGATERNLEEIAGAF